MLLRLPRESSVVGGPQGRHERRWLPIRFCRNRERAVDPTIKWVGKMNVQVECAVCIECAVQNGWSSSFLALGDVKKRLREWPHGPCSTTIIGPVSYTHLTLP